MTHCFLISIIGEGKTLSIKVGTEAGDLSTEDVILVRGISSEVSRAVKDILKIVEDAKNDEIVSSYVGILISITPVIINGHLRLLSLTSRKNMSVALSALTVLGSISFGNNLR